MQAVCCMWLQHTMTGRIAHHPRHSTASSPRGTLCMRFPHKIYTAGQHALVAAPYIVLLAASRGLGSGAIGGASCCKSIRAPAECPTPASGSQARVCRTFVCSSHKVTCLVSVLATNRELPPRSTRSAFSQAYQAKQTRRPYSILGRLERSLGGHNAFWVGWNDHTACR